jgi:hypothetical protein
MNSGDEQIPGFLRDPGVSNSQPLEKRGPGGCELPGKVLDAAENFSQTRTGRQATGDGRKLLALAELDELLPFLQLRAYRPRVSWQRKAPSEKQLKFLEGIGFLSHNYSPESLFDAYFKHPWRLLICDDANATLTKRQNPHDGERLSSNFLSLFDGKRLSENFRRNRTEGNLESQERWTESTSTNIIFGATFNACEFRGNTQRAGLQRRFLCYVAEDRARRLHRPQPDEVRLQGLTRQFSLLSHLPGPFTWTSDSEMLFDQFKDTIDERIRDCDILDDGTRGRLTTACA